MLSDREYAEKLKAVDRAWRETQPAEEGSFEPLPSGTYEGIVMDAKLTESSTGTIGLNVQFEVTKGDYEGRYIFHTFWVTSKNIPYVKRDMGMLGCSINSVGDVINAQKRLMNKKAILHVGQEEYDGRMRNKVRSFSRLDDTTRQRELKDDQYQF